MAKKTPMFWQGHPVDDEEHHNKLDLEAAIHEFHHGMDRKSAEEKVKHQDRVERHQKAGAHHLDGMRAANAVGNHEDAQQHHAMYSLHLKALGLDPTGAVPPEVAKWREVDGKKHAYTFKGHGDDQFLTQPVDGAPTGLAKGQGVTLGLPIAPGWNIRFHSVGGYPLYDHVSSGAVVSPEGRHEGRPTGRYMRTEFNGYSSVHDTLQDAIEGVRASKVPREQLPAKQQTVDVKASVVNPQQKLLGKSEEGTPDTTCENCGQQRSPLEVRNDYCSGCAKELDDVKVQAQANMHWGEQPSFGAASPEAKAKLLTYLKGLGVKGAQVEDVPAQKPALAVVQGTQHPTAPKFGHLRVVKAEAWPHILGCWRNLAKADPAQAQGKVKQFDVRRTWLRHRHLPEEKAFDYSSWLTPGQHQNGYRMFVLSHGNGNPVRVHVVHNQQKAGSASGNVDQGDLEVENYSLAGGGHHDRGLEASMLNAMMGHAKSNMGANYLSHGPFTPEASGFIEAMAKPHGFELGEAEDIDEGETPADQKPATLVSGGVKVRSNQPNRVPRSFSPKVPQWWRTAAEEND